MSDTSSYYTCSSIAQIQAANFVEPVQKAFGSNPDFQLVQINLQDNLVKSWLVGFAIGAPFLAAFLSIFQWAGDRFVPWLMAFLYVAQFSFV